MKKRPFHTYLATLPLAAAALAFSAVNGQCANPAYPSAVQADGALGYYRFNDSVERTLIHVNSGSLGAAGNAVNDPMYYKSGTEISHQCHRGGAIIPGRDSRGWGPFRVLRFHDSD